MKRYLAILLTLAMLAGMIPAAFAEELSDTFVLANESFAPVVEAIEEDSDDDTADIEWGDEEEADVADEGEAGDETEWIEEEEAEAGAEDIAAAEVSLSLDEIEEQAEEGTEETVLEASVAVEAAAVNDTKTIYVSVTLPEGNDWIVMQGVDDENLIEMEPVSGNEGLYSGELVVGTTYYVGIGKKVELAFDYINKNEQEELTITVEDNENNCVTLTVDDAEEYWTAAWSQIAEPEVAFALKQKTLLTRPGREDQLTAIGVPDGATVTWQSGNDTVVTVDENGVVTAVAVGTATITATMNGTPVQCEVTVFNGYVTWNSETDKETVIVDELQITNFKGYVKSNAAYNFGNIEFTVTEDEGKKTITDSLGSSFSMDANEQMTVKDYFEAYLDAYIGYAKGSEYSFLNMTYTSIVAPAVDVPSENAVCTVGETPYNSLVQAVNAISESDTKIGTITMCANYTTQKQAVIPEDTTIKLDFAGYTISSTLNGTYAPIENHGTLTLLDTSSEKQGGITGVNRCVNNYGTLNVGSGTFDSSSKTTTGKVFGGIYSTSNRSGGTAIRNATASSVMNVYDCVVNATMYGVYNYGTATVYGGTFNGDSCVACEGGTSYAYTFSSVKTVTIYDAVITGVHGALAVSGGTGTVYGGTYKVEKCKRRVNSHQDEYGAHYALYVAGDKAETSCTVYGGSFSSEGYAVINNGNSGDGGLKQKAFLKIYGGSFEGKSSYTTIFQNDNVLGYPQLAGGRYKAQNARKATEFMNSVTSKQYLAPGFALDKVDETTYDVVGPMVEVLTGTGESLTHVSYHATLKEAVAAAKDGEKTTIVLVRDAELSEALVIPAEKIIRLVLNGHDIIGNVAGKMIQNSGTLSIMDDDADDTGSPSGKEATAIGNVYNTNTSNQGSDAVFNEESGVLYVYSGHFGDADDDQTNENHFNRGAAVRNYGTATIYGGTFTDIDNDFISGAYAYSLINEGTLVVEDGTVYGSMNGAIANNKGSLTVNGGSFTVNQTHSNTSYYAVWVTNDGETSDVTINGGTFSGAQYGLYTSVDDDNQNVGDVKIFLKGGTFSGGTKAAVALKGNAERSFAMSITGGEFNSDPSFYVAAGYAAKPNIADNPTWWSVVDAVASITSEEEPITTTYYATFDAAVKAAKPVEQGGTYKTITLLADISETYTLSEDETLKVCRNGHTLEVAAPAGKALKTAISGSGASAVYTYNVLSEIPDVDKATYNGATGLWELSTAEDGAIYYEVKVQTVGQQVNVTTLTQDQTGGYAAPTNTCGLSDEDIGALLIAEANGRKTDNQPLPQTGTVLKVKLDARVNESSAENGIVYNAAMQYAVWNEAFAPCNGVGNISGLPATSFKVLVPATFAGNAVKASWPVGDSETTSRTIIFDAATRWVTLPKESCKNTLTLEPFTTENTETTTTTVALNNDPVDEAHVSMDEATNTAEVPVNLDVTTTTYEQGQQTDTSTQVVVINPVVKVDKAEDEANTRVQQFNVAGVVQAVLTNTSAMHADADLTKIDEVRVAVKVQDQENTTEEGMPAIKFTVKPQAVAYSNGEAVSDPVELDNGVLKGNGNATSFTFMLSVEGLKDANSNDVKAGDTVKLVHKHTESDEGIITYGTVVNYQGGLYVRATTRTGFSTWTVSVVSADTIHMLTMKVGEEKAVGDLISPAPTDPPTTPQNQDVVEITGNSGDYRIKANKVGNTTVKAKPNGSNEEHTISVTVKAAATALRAGVHVINAAGTAEVNSTELNGTPAYIVTRTRTCTGTHAAEDVYSTPTLTQLDNGSTILDAINAMELTIPGGTTLDIQLMYSGNEYIGAEAKLDEGFRDAGWEARIGTKYYQTFNEAANTDKAKAKETIILLKAVANGTPDNRYEMKPGDVLKVKLGNYGSPVPVKAPEGKFEIAAETPVEGVTTYRLSVKYLDGTSEMTTGSTDYGVLKDESGNVILDKSCYVVDKDTQIGTIEVEDGKKVALILCDGATLTVNSGIMISSGAKLTVYTQSIGDHAGKLVAAKGSNSAAVSGTGELILGTTSGQSTEKIMVLGDSIANPVKVIGTNAANRKDYMTIQYVPHAHLESDGTGIAFLKAWTSAETNESIPSKAGSYYLTANMTLPGQWNVPGPTTYLCLNGHDITGADGAETINIDGTTLNLYECHTGEQRGKITHASGKTGSGVKIASNGQFNMWNGVISGNRNEGGAGVDVQSGTFTMHGGTITGNEGTETNSCGGVYVIGGSTFTMLGGEITENNLQFSDTYEMLFDSRKCGVYISPDSTFKVADAARITGNTKILTEGTRTYTKASNVYLDGNGTQVSKITVEGALSNTDKIGVSMATPGVFTTGYATNNKDVADKVIDPSTFFTSENPGYAVRKNASGEAVLSTLYALTVEPITHGRVTTDAVNDRACEGDAITLTVTPDSGYQLVRLTYTTGTGSAQTVAGPTYSFTMGAGDTVVNAEFWPVVDYVDAAGTAQTAKLSEPVTVTSTAWNATGTSGGWYVVNDDVTIENRVAITGNVNLILANGKTLTAKKGITVGEGNSLTIWQQSVGANETVGKLYAGTENGTYSIGEVDAAGIGGTNGAKAGTITINGGAITAYGGFGSGTGGAKGGAGIGSGESGTGGTITINNGSITATGGNGGAAIGGGRNGTGGTIAINGGTINATGTNGGAGIGGGNSNIFTSITITGGTVTATGVNGASAIGNGFHISTVASSGTITISGGTVDATVSSNVTGIGGDGCTTTLTQNTTATELPRVTASSYAGTVVLSNGFKDVTQSSTKAFIAGNYTSSTDVTAFGGTTLIPATVHTVTVTPGSNMTLTSGSATQYVADNNSVTQTVYTAATNYYFAADAATVTQENDGTVAGTRSNDYSTLTISGTVKSDVTINLKATAKVKETTPNASFTPTGGASGTLSNVDNAMKYSLDGGTTWIAIAGTSASITEGVTTLNGISVYKPATDSRTRLDSEVQHIGVQQHSKPAAAPVTKSVGYTTVELQPTNGYQYAAVPKDAGAPTADSAWQDSPSFTGLSMGTNYDFYQRVKATDDKLASPASDPLTVRTLVYTPPVHTHSWTYTASGATISATCGTGSGAHTGSVTLVAPALTAYGGSESAAATLEGGIAGVTPSIVYKAGDTVLPAVPTTPGSYTASITLGDATASVDYSIARKAVTITGLGAEDKVYDGTTAATATGTATISGKVGTDDVTVIAGTASFMDKNAGPDKDVTFAGYSLGGAEADRYTLAAQPAAVKAAITAKPLADCMLTLTPAKTAYTGQKQTPTVTVTDGTATLAAGTDYTVTENDGGTAVGTYPVKIAAVAGGNYSGEKSASFEIEKAALDLRLTMADYVEGKTPGTPVLTGNAGGATPTYAYASTDGGNYASDQAPTVAGAYRVTATVPETDNYLGGTATATFNVRKPTITFMSEGAVYTTQTLEGTTATRPADPTSATYKDFTGWLLNGKAYDFTTPVTDDMVLTAGWTASSFKRRVNFEGQMRIVFTFTPSRAATAAGVKVVLTDVGGKTTQTAVSSLESGKLVVPIMLPESARQVTIKLVDAAGRPVALVDGDGIDRTDGFAYSVLDYAKDAQVKSENPLMRALGKALEDYVIAARINFKVDDYSGLVVSPEVAAVTEIGEGVLRSGELPEGIVESKVSVNFEYDHSLRVSYTLASGKSPSDYTLKVTNKDGVAKAVEWENQGNGVYYVKVKNIAGAELGDAYTYTISAGGKTHTTVMSGVRYCATALEKGTATMKDLGRACYLYYKAAAAYFA